MIAGTSFTICRLQDEWPRLLERIMRTKTPANEISALAGFCARENAIPMMCSDGFVVMALEGQRDGTIAAVVYLAASFGEPGAFARQEAAMVTVAKDAGATSLRFETYRKGWKRLLGPEWEKVGNVFTRSI